MNHKALIAIATSILLVSCTNQSQVVRLPSITPQPTVTLFPTSTPIPTITLRPTNSPTASPTVPSTLTLEPWPKWDISYNLFTFRELSPIETISPETARSFIGIRIPPLPDGVTQEFVRFFPDGGEMPSSTLYYQVFIMRLGNARMLWLGVPFEEWNTFDESRIYDAIPLPPIETDNILIPFSCAQHPERDPYLEKEPYYIVIATRPNDGEYATDIHYAWQIDPTNTTLKPVYYQDLKCWTPY